MPELTLCQELDTLSKYRQISREIPNCVIDNLRDEFPLREYQVESLSRLFFYLTEFQNRIKPTQLLFHMATGSGKTLIMAGAILYLYQLGYRNFIFFVNNTNIIEKTKENFLNPNSSKYLFSNQIQYRERQIRINHVENFSEASREDINIIFTTIQGLHTSLNTPRENLITFEDFEGQKIALISDEAHHINALTKSQLTLSEEEQLKTWESTVNRVFKASLENILLEFTATADLGHPLVAEKYVNKILFQYSLREFRLDGFSKDVITLQTDLPPVDRALQAVVISQFRRKVAEKNKLFLKPVILMKSKTISDSEDFENEFHEAIKNLNKQALQGIAKHANNDIISDAFTYFKDNNISLDNLAEEIIIEFNPERCLIINSKSESEEKQILVNSLEDAHNEIRVVFAVDKLNEGWDVLNLFDIVRLYETRDSRSGRPGRTTIAEAQLIGRGARYFPFKIDPNDPKFQRKYDEETDNEIRNLETLHYHSSYNPRYIQELRQALIQTGIIPERAREIHLKVKDAFIQTSFWNSGALFVNEKIKNLRRNVNSFSDVNIPTTYTSRLQTGITIDTNIFEENLDAGEEITTHTYRLLDFEENVIRKGINKLRFYRFNNLIQYFPNLNSMNDFIQKNEYLKSISVEVSGVTRQVNNLSSDDKLNITLIVLERISRDIDAGYYEAIGSKEFKPIGIKYCVEDKYLKIMIEDSGIQEFGRGMNETSDITLNLNLSGKDWYVYDENYGTSEEKRFVRYFNNVYEKLEEKYSDIYLLRNAKLFQIYSFTDGSALEPDFILFLTNKSSKEQISLQLFIEPKGEPYIAHDQWKEDFLKEIEIEAQVGIKIENKEFRIYGLPFFNESMRKDEFVEEFNRILEIESP